MAISATRALWFRLRGGGGAARYSCDLTQPPIRGFTMGHPVAMEVQVWPWLWIRGKASRIGPILAIEFSRALPPWSWVRVTFLYGSLP